MDRKTTHGIVQNETVLQERSLTDAEKSKLSLVISQTAEKLLSDRANDNMLSESSFISTIREIDTTGLIQQIENRLSRKIIYQDIAGIALCGGDMIKTLDYSHLRDSNGSRRFSALARVYIQKTIEKISSITVESTSINGGTWKANKKYTKNLVQSYKSYISGSRENPTLEQAITNYNDWIEENKKLIVESDEFLHDVQISVDDLFHKKDKTFEDHKLIQDLVGFGAMRQAVAENTVQQAMRNEWLKMSKKIRISDLLADEYSAFEESIGEANKADWEEKDNAEKTKEFLSHLRKRSTKSEDIAMVNALEEIYLHKNDLTKCSKETQAWFLEKQKMAWKKSGSYDAVSSMLQKFISISKEDVDKITDAILGTPNWTTQNIQCKIDGNPTKISLATKLREGEYNVWGDYIENWDRPLPLDITINWKDVLSLGDDCPIQNGVVLCAMIAHGDSLSEEEKTSLLEKVNEELRPQVQKGTKLSSSLTAPTKHTFSTSEVLSNLMADDTQKLIRAEKLCGGELSQTQKDAIIESHNVGTYKNKEDAPAEIRDRLTFHDGERYEVWKDGKTHARWRNYSQVQLKRKMEIMRNAWFSMQQAAMLVRAWITGKLSREEEIEITKKDIEETEKELEGIKSTIDEVKSTGSIDWSAPVNLQQIKTDLRDIAREIDQLEKERASFKFEAWKPWISGADRLHYEAEAKRVADQIKLLADRQAELEEQRAPISTYIAKEEKKLDSAYVKLNDKKERLKQLEKAEEREDDEKQDEEKDASDIEWGSVESSGEMLKEVWDQIKWEKNAEPKVWTSLFLREWIFENYFPKELNAEVWNWIELRVKEVNESTGAMTFTIHGVFKPLYDADGKTKIEWKTLSPMSPKTIKEKILQSTYDEVYKLKNVSGIKEWGEHMKNADIDFVWASGWLDNKHQARLKDMRSQVDFWSMKKIKMDNTSEPWAGDDVKYFGADREFYDEKSWSYKPFRLWYKVKKADGNQIVLEEWGKGGDGKAKTEEHTFTPQWFFFFSAENNLRPYTQWDVDAINKNSLANNAEWQEFINDAMRSSDNPPSDLMLNASEWRWLFGLKWWSIKSVIASFKKIKKEWIDKWFDERAKQNEELVWNAMMTSKAAKWLSGAKIPWISEITGLLADDVENKIDAEKTNKIKEAKEEPSKAGNSWPFWPQIFIGKSIFNDNPFKWNEIGASQFIYAQKNPLKVAWYFLFCCENGWPYAKALANYDNSWSWVKLLLWEKYQQQYLRERAELKKEIESLPHDSTDRIAKQDLYAKQDLWFLQAFWLAQGLDSPRKKIYGEAFFSKMLWWAELAWNSQKQLQAAEADTPDAKLFDNIKTDYYNHLQSGRGATSTGALWKMAAKVQGNERYYYDWTGAMLFSMLSWSIKHNFVENGKEWFASLSRKYAFVPWLYAMDGNWEQQLMRLIDIIAKNTWATTLSAYEKKTEKGPIKFKLWDINAAKNNGLIIQEWIHKPESRGVIDALMSPEKLLTMMDKLRSNAGEPAPGQPALNDYNVLKDYLENKFMDTEESSMGNMDDVKRSVIFTKHIWTFSPALVKRLMWANNNYSTFPSATADIGPILWRKLWSWVDEMSRWSFSQQSFQFLLKRFTQYFDRLNPEEQRLLIVGIRDKNSQMIHSAISWSYDRKWNWVYLHPDIWRTFSLFEKAFFDGWNKWPDGRRLHAFEWIDGWSDVKNYYKTDSKIAEEKLNKRIKNKEVQDIFSGYFDD